MWCDSPLSHHYSVGKEMSYFHAKRKALLYGHPSNSYDHNIASNLNHVNPLQPVTDINLRGLNPYLQNAT